MIHPSPDVALPLVLMRKFPLLRNACRLVAKLWAYSPNRYTTTCIRCNENTFDIVVHHLLECTDQTTKQLKDTFWTSIVNMFHVEVYVYLDYLTIEVLVANLLGGFSCELIEYQLKTKNCR